jgi:hypothetical protein
MQAGCFAVAPDLRARAQASCSSARPSGLLAISNTARARRARVNLLFTINVHS